jgi:hypothetical protein
VPLPTPELGSGRAPSCFRPEITAGDTVVAVVPVTHSPPQRPDEAVEIPPAVKRLLGLDEARSWIVVSEINRLVWPGPDLRPVSSAEPERFEFGFLPPGLFRQVLERFTATVAARRLRTSGAQNEGRNRPVSPSSWPRART